MARLRFDIIDLTPFGFEPFAVDLDCYAWRLRLRGLTPNGAYIDGVDCIVFADLAGNVSMDFPGIFDADGVPINYNQTLNLGTPRGAEKVIRGSITRIYRDENGPATQD